jgi:hypothetical protein
MVEKSLPLEAYTTALPVELVPETVLRSTSPDRPVGLPTSSPANVLPLWPFGPIIAILSVA